MVAQHFLDTWDSTLQVNHIDGDKQNNHFENLEMVTPSENMFHAHHTKIGGARHLHKGGDSNAARLVHQYTREGEYIATYSSTYQAQCTTGVSSGNLSQCASGKRSSAGGFLWSWSEEQQLAA